MSKSGMTPLDNALTALSKKGNENKLMSCIRMLALAKNVKTKVLLKQLILTGIENDPDREFFYSFYEKATAAEKPAKRDNSPQD